MNPLPDVFDCNLYAQALINPGGPAGACLAAAQAGRVKVFVTDFVVQEIRELPGKLPAKLGVTPDRIEALILDLAKYAEPVDHVPATFQYDRDADDAHYVNLSHVSKARFIVTRDRDLLHLMSDPGFRQGFPMLSIINPPAFLHELARQKAERP